MHSFSVINDEKFRLVQNTSVDSGIHHSAITLTVLDVPRIAMTQPTFTVPVSNNV